MEQCVLVHACITRTLTAAPDSVKLFDSIPSNGQTNYAAFAHPEYASADGLTQYVTYYQTGTMQQRLVKVVLR